MNEKDINDSFGLNEYRLIQKADTRVRKFKLISKRIYIIFLGCIVVALFILFFYRDKFTSTTIIDGSLPGADKIYPAVMYNDNIYYWRRLAGPAVKVPQGELPPGYEYVGDINYADSGQLTEDYQFTATFSATGKLYYKKDDPQTVCICINTFWLKDSYVIFSQFDGKWLDQ